MDRVALALSKPGVPRTPELLRVLALPRRTFALSDYPDASPLYIRDRCDVFGCLYCEGGPPRLKPIQSAILIEAATHRGAFIAAGIGQGKTLASFLLHDALRAERTVLLVPANLRDKTLAVDLPALQRHFQLPPVYRASDFRQEARPGVYVLGYSEISHKSGSGLLEEIAPDLVVGDEVQALKDVSSARSKRFFRYMRSRPDCRFVAMTGSPMTRSIRDFSAFLTLALREGAPVPSDYHSAQAWADAIDREGEWDATGIGALVLFCEGDESAQKAFSRRLVQTPGVIVTTEPSCTLPLRFQQLHLEPPKIVVDALEKLEREWEWDGEQFSEILEIVNLRTQLVQGYYWRFVWPDGKDIEWLEKRNNWASAIRRRLKHRSRTGEDSAGLLTELAERGEWTPPEWLEWLTVRERKYDREAVVISEWLIDVALQWAAQNVGIIWVGSPVLGTILERRGVPYYGEGADAELNALAASCLAGAPTTTIACSYKAHGTGKNLQAWSHNLVLHPFGQGATWEQVLGRTHRPGQRASEVHVDVVLTPYTLPVYETALKDAAKIETVLTQPQRLGMAIGASI